ncbi:MAG: methylenetetrahydrofolate reductase C-terminal domain-containing protein [Arenicellales bacterium]|nr:methylenetetrahydrofolate reductase C-terminal domain-containing protein [Arenicellales bacterium]
MIVAEQKKLEDIQRMLKGKKKVLTVGCGTCVSVCFAGGQKESSAMAATLRTAAAANGEQIEVDEATVQRQCVQEFVAPLEENIEEYDAVLSMACGVGVQTLAEKYMDTPILPGLDTNFMGQPTEPGVWEERCVGCGNCVLEYTGGLCPITRCPKQLQNGPCGGSEGGMCEVDPNIPCIWSKIWTLLDRQGIADTLMDIQPPKDWSTSRGGSMRRVVVSSDLSQQSARAAGDKIKAENTTPTAPVMASTTPSSKPVDESVLDASWHQVCSLSDLPEGKLRRFTVSGVDVMLTNLGDCIRAFPPTCPHLAEPLIDSGVLRDGLLTCTKHLWKWDLRSGEMKGAAERPVEMYESQLKNDNVFVRMESEIIYDYEEDDDLDEDDFFNAD